jgi:membrane protease YdiL (CAAX protease family)
VAIIGGGAIYYLLFPGRFDPSMAFARETGKISATDTLAAVLSREALGGLISVLAGALLLFIGEEFGWRAYLLPKLMPLGPRTAVLLVGAIWGAWHWPMIFMGFQYGLDYWGAPVVGPLLFVLIILSPSVVFSWVTLRSGSVWPACIGHTTIIGVSWVSMAALQGPPNLLLNPSPDGLIGNLGFLALALVLLSSRRAFAGEGEARPEKALAVVIANRG